ncbi:hypothetical protein M885DRAFT_532354 [Pelagophyceae sp. CCMP2097]|nr:hypothetical protein M885DRAFT_532354 [Pelagophyceae sp. CCMP2097]
MAPWRWVWAAFVALARGADVDVGADGAVVEADRPETAPGPEAGPEAAQGLYEAAQELYETAAGRGAGGSGEAAAPGEAAAAALYDAELALLDESIRQQQRKVALLSALRLARAQAPPPGAGDQAVCAAIDAALRAAGVDCGVSNVAASPPPFKAWPTSEDAPRRPRPRGGGKRHDDETAFEDVILERLAVSPAAVVAQVEMLSFRVRGRAPARSKGRRGAPPVAPYLNLIAVAYTNGTIDVFDGGGDRVFAFDSGLVGADVLTFDGSDEPLLFVGAGKLTKMFNLTLWRGETVLAGRKPRRPRPRRNGGDAATDLAESEEAPAPGPAFRTASGLGLVVQHEFSTIADHDVTAAGLFSWRNAGKVLALGDAQGHLRLFYRNGTLQRGARVSQRAVSLILRAGSAFAIADGPAVIFVSASKLTLLRTSCKGPAADVTAMAYDALAASMLYVGYANGDVVSFNTRAKSADTSSNAPACSLAQKLPGAAHSGPVDLAAVRGFLISSSQSALAIHNATTKGLRLVATKQFKVADQTPLSKTHFTASFSHGMHMSEVLLARQFSSGAVRVYESLLLYEPPTSDVAWLRVPILIVGLAVVFGFQLLRNKGPGGGGGGGFAGGGNGARLAAEALSGLQGMPGMEGMPGLGGSGFGGAGQGSGFGGSDFGGSGFGAGPARNLGNNLRNMDMHEMPPGFGGSGFGGNGRSPRGAYGQPRGSTRFQGGY